MGKRIDDLPLDDTPLDDPAPDPRGTAWYRFIEEIDDLLATGQYTWAEDTLRSIAQTVEEHKWVTPGQRQAVANIEAGAYKGRRRRYEGFTRNDHKNGWGR